MADIPRTHGTEVNPSGADAAGTERRSGVSPSDELKVDDGPGEIIRHGRTTVVTGGTRVSLIGAGVRTRSVTIKADKGNADEVFVGGSTVTVANGFPLEDRDTVTLEVDNAEDEIFIDSIRDGDSVDWIAVDKDK